MKQHILIATVVAFAAALLLPGRAEAQTRDGDIELLVTMPQPPASITRLDERCNYIVENYWKTFNPKASFSSLKRLDDTFGQFLQFTPYATADTVHLAIERLLDSVGKAKPENLVTLASIAERWCQSDTAQYFSEELYFPFVQAVSTNKKAKGDLRPRFEAHYRQLLDSRLNCNAPAIDIKHADGTVTPLRDIKATQTLVIFYDPACTDCRLAKARLSADFTLNALIRQGELAVVAIYPGKANDPEWADAVASMPENWICGAAPDAEDHFTMRFEPEIYYLDGDHIIRAKDVSVDNVLAAFEQYLKK